MERIYKMNQDAKLLGTDLILREGDLITVIEATNLPQGGYFARPAFRPWAYGGPEDSIHLDGHEFDFYAVHTNYTPPVYPSQ